MEPKKLYESPTTEVVALDPDGNILAASIDQYEPVEW